MNFFLNSIVEQFGFDFIKRSSVIFSISALLIIVTFVMCLFKGINFGVDFTGGTVFEIKSVGEKFELDKIRQDLQENNIGEAVVQSIDSRGKNIMVKLKGKQDSEQVKAVFLGYKVEYDRIDYVGPQVSSELIYKGVAAITLALFGMFFYLLVRFNISFAVSGVIGLVHDVVLIIGLFSVTQMEFNIPSVAAVLTIIGYSINDSVVIFDRIREHLGKKMEMDFNLVINKAIHSTLTRTILTSLTTVCAAIPLVVVGKGTLHDFSLVILFGVLIGTYSSVFIAGPLLTFLPIYKARNN